MGAVIGAVVGILGMGGMGLYIWRRWASEKAELAKWLVVPGTPLRYRSALPVDVRQLALAYAHMVTCLNEVPEWAGRVSGAFVGKKVYVRAEEEWDFHGQRVNGNLNESLDTMTVGPSLAGLGHEGAHIVSHRLTGNPNHDHDVYWKSVVQPVIALYDARYPLPASS